MEEEPILDVFLEIGQRGQPGEIPDVNALAIANHIFRTENNEPELDVYTTNRFIESAPSAEYRDRYVRAVLLGGMNPLDVQRLDSGIYQYLLYYYLLNMNENPVIRPNLENNHQIIQTAHLTQFKRDLSNAPRDVRNLALRINYAPILAGILTDHSTSSEINEYIQETIMGSIFAYTEIGPVMRQEAAQGWDIQSRMQSIETFYPGLEAVPVPEMFMNVTGIRRVTDRYEFDVKFADAIQMIMKVSETDGDLIVREYMIGEELNKLYSKCPFVTYSYGLMNNFLVSSMLDQYLPVFDNRSQYSIGSENSGPVPVYLGQWLSGAISLRDFLMSRPVGRKIIDGEIVEMTEGETLMMVLTTLFATLQFLYDSIGFVHGGITGDNVMIRRLETPISIPLPGLDTEDQLYFNCDHMPVLTDYSKSSIRVIPGSTGPVISNSPIDARIVTKYKNIEDYERVMRVIFQYSPEINSWTEESGEYTSPLLDELVLLHYRLLTGRDITATHPEFDLMKNKLLTVMTEEDILERTLPYGLDTFDPHSAIDRLIPQWVSKDGSGDANEDLDDVDLNTLINSGARRTITSTTYTGLLALELDPRYSQAQINRTRGVTTSFSNQVRLLEMSYADQLRLYGLNMSPAQLRIADTIAIYRDQINKYIRDLISMRGRRATEVNVTLSPSDDYSNIIVEEVSGIGSRMSPS